MNTSTPTPHPGHAPSVEELFQAYRSAAGRSSQRPPSAGGPSQSAPAPSRLKWRYGSLLVAVAVAAVVCLVFWVALPAPDGYCMNLAANRQANIQTIHNALCQP